MNFPKLFHKSNSSIHQIQGTVLDCSIEQIRGNKVIVDTGVRASFVCFRDELSEHFIAGLSGYSAASQPTMRDNLQQKETPGLVPTVLLKNRQVTRSIKLDPQLGTTTERVCLQTQLRCATKRQILRSCATKPNRRTLAFAPVDPKEGLQQREVEFFCQFGKSCVIGVEDKRSSLSGELTFSAPKSMQKLSTRKLVWTELSRLWRTSAKNRMKGFILNSVNGGYAVAIAGYIAFLPKSLCLNKKVFIGQWRQFAIIGMNPKIANIVVKEVRASSAVAFRKRVRTERYRSNNIS